MRLFVAVLLISITGCWSSGIPSRPDGIEVQGTIQLPSGKPLTGGTLILRPDSGLYGATALIQPDGSFKLQETSGSQSIVPGKYQVFVSFPNPAHSQIASAVPKRYQQSEDGDSDVFVDLQAGVQSLEIRLKR